MLSRNPNRAAMDIMRGRVQQALTERLTAQGANPLAAKIVVKQLLSSMN